MITRISCVICRKGLGDLLITRITAGLRAFSPSFPLTQRHAVYLHNLEADLRPIRRDWVGRSSLKVAGSRSSSRKHPATGRPHRAGADVRYAAERTSGRPNWEAWNHPRKASTSCATTPRGRSLLMTTSSIPAPAEAAIDAAASRRSSRRPLVHRLPAAARYRAAAPSGARSAVAAPAPPEPPAPLRGCGQNRRARRA